MAKDFRTALADSQQGSVAESHAYDSQYWGQRRAFSQVIADATRGMDAGMNRFTPQKPDTSSSRYAPDWRGHYLGQEMPDVLHAISRVGRLRGRRPGLGSTSADRWSMRNSFGTGRMPLAFQICCRRRKCTSPRFIRECL